MDNYMELGADLVMPEFTLVQRTHSDTMMASNTIVLRSDILDNCPMIHELRENMSKRLVTTGKMSGGPNLCVVAMMCLASSDYSVSHTTLCDVTENYMVKVWSYLERQVISSSYLLRQWMRSHVGTRTCEGYMARWNISRSLGPTIGNTLVQQGSWTKCVDITKDMAYKVYGQPETVLESAHCDIATSSKVRLPLIR